ncbi:hypothetical protein CC80DRAFT_553064 [Byssothecium circinans]|uniref:Uncharacterized protein n=1 Tax=Byssothecium circinans TaxID=147558 RepID=A0A6A5TFU7_9PLEO|nr:hypothetical protein CC80DRAFT_553064 [Byssothecium circinans]
MSSSTAQVSPGQPTQQVQPSSPPETESTLYPLCIAERRSASGCKGLFLRVGLEQDGHAAYDYYAPEGKRWRAMAFQKTELQSTTPLGSMRRQQFGELRRFCQEQFEKNRAKWIETVVGLLRSITERYRHIEQTPSLDALSGTTGVSTSPPAAVPTSTLAALTLAINILVTVSSYAPATTTVTVETASVPKPAP